MTKGIRILISISVLAIGITTLILLKNSKPEAKKTSIETTGSVVEFTAVGETSSTVVVNAHGTVLPARSVTMGAEVGGKVIYISKSLQPGGKFKKGDVIARIDPRDYKIAVQQQFAAVDAAEAQLAMEAGRAEVAKREWEMFGENNKGNKQLALHEPQMRSVTTQLKSAQSGLQRARLHVHRTNLRAPFDGMVQTTGVELGQIVSPGSPLLSYVGTDSYWIQISIPQERLIWLSIPGIANQHTGSPATISHQVGNQTIQKEGHILRLLAGVDPAGHMARILIEVDDPLGETTKQTNSPPMTPTPVSNQQSSHLPLLLGSYVEVAIQGRQAENVVELERSSLRDGNTVYILEDDLTLGIRAVKILWRTESSVLISDGLQSGDKVIVSPLSTPVEGMKLRLPDRQNRQNRAQMLPQDQLETELPETATRNGHATHPVISAPPGETTNE